MCFGGVLSAFRLHPFGPAGEDALQHARRDEIGSTGTVATKAGDLAGVDSSVETRA